MPVIELADRAVLAVSGEDARGFLDRLVTCDLDRVAPGRPRYGALLTPQGKIIADFILHEVAGGYLIDTPAACLADLTKRLGLYKLRAKVSLADRRADLAVLAGWDAPPPDGAEASAPDPRVPALGWRAIVVRTAVTASTDAAPYAARRVALGVPESGLDFALNDAFPHEALMDQMAGVDFDKGCYVGQEVVSRMQHRGTARTRVVRVALVGPVPEPGTPVVAGERALGAMASAAGGHGLAMIRVDRAADALAEGVAMLAAGQVLTPDKPDWVRFAYPGEAPAPA